MWAAFLLGFAAFPVSVVFAAIALVAVVRWRDRRNPTRTAARHPGPTFYVDAPDDRAAALRLIASTRPLRPARDWQ